MMDHLPECPHADASRITFYGGYCVCPLLRACEQRVLGDRDEIVGITAVRSFRAGLDAAEEDLWAAAEREKQEGDMDDLYDGIRYSAERIRALKEKP